MANISLWKLAVSVAVAIAIIVASVESYSLTCSQVVSAAADLRNAISTDFAKDEDGKSYRRLIGGFLRLAFHMCTGGKCKGCINVNDPSNLHLDQYVAVLERLYARNAVFSRGDFWILAAMVGLVESEKLTNSLLGRNFTYMRDGLTFRFGRIDCSPNTPFSSILNAFPDASRGVDHVLSFFAEHFNLNAHDTVVLLGAHNCGGIRSPITHSIVRQWVSPADTLTNQWYTSMLDNSNNWTQAAIPLCRNCPPVHMFQNVHRKRMMLNADICLRKNLTFVNGVGGLASCTMATCQDSATLPLVQRYADSDEDWQEDFAVVMMKMVETGYKSTELQPLKNCQYF